MQNQLGKERRITETLEEEKRLNGEELGRLGEEFNTLSSQLNDLTYAFENKQRELDELRI